MCINVIVELFIVRVLLVYNLNHAHLECVDSNKR